jgi:hypothetical protein
MNKLPIFSAVSHNSTIESIKQVGSIVTIAIEDVNLGDIDHEDYYHQFLVTIKDIKKILRNDDWVDSISYEADDGEIIDLTQKNGVVYFTVQWENFDPRSSEPVTYEFVGGIMSFELIS